MSKPYLAYSRPQARSWSEATDRELLLAVASDDESAFDALMARKTPPLLQLAYRMLGDREEARDVVQVTFLRVWSHRARYDRRWSPNTWLYRIATNLAIDQLRARRSRQRASEPIRLHLRRVADARSCGDLGRLGRQEVRGILEELAGKLSERQRAVFLLREVEGLASPEVARILGCKSSTVRNHLFAARRILRRELARRYPEYAAGVAPQESS
ncbi:MAG: RNA polymerase sigma factor [Thermoanaerobaculia bacterium]